jgi:hypothetical protein
MVASASAAAIRCGMTFASPAHARRKRSSAPPVRLGVASLAQAPDGRDLARGGGGVWPVDRRVLGLIGLHVGVDADDPPLAALDPALEGVRRVGDLPLGVPASTAATMPPSSSIRAISAIAAASIASVRASM